MPPFDHQAPDVRSEPPPERVMASPPPSARSANCGIDGVALGSPLSLKPAHWTVTDREALVPAVPLRFAVEMSGHFVPWRPAWRCACDCAHWMAPCMPASAAYRSKRFPFSTYPETPLTDPN